ncbi:MAG: hypothetical protein K2M88_07985 [Muribaculaceae bacterium]|nr:hypothetical protein [Muribaculaceae bacterium]
MKGILLFSFLFVFLFVACSNSHRVQEQASDKSDENPLGNMGWEISQNQNEWGDEEEGKNAFGAFIGTFSNSATDNGNVAVAMYVKTIKVGESLDTIIGFSLGEYDGRNTVKDMDFKGKARNSKGEIQEFTYYIGNNGVGMLLSDMNADIFQFLYKGGNIDVILEEDTQYGVPSKYKFTIPSYLSISDALEQINK